MTPVGPRKTEAEKWRDEAHDALARLSKIMQFFLHSAAELVKLTNIHSPDDFTHCMACKAPWPCETAKIVQGLGQAWAKLREEENG